MIESQSVLYERLFQLNQCLEQAAAILEQFRQEGVIHHIYAEKRSRAVEELRSDLSYVLTGMLHRRELEASVGLAAGTDGASGAASGSKNQE
jgi:hypothetical protein